jgi:integrase
MTLLARLERTDGHVFYETDPVEPLTTNRLEKAWRRLRNKAGVPDGRLHDFRHTTGTYAAHAGLNAFMVRDLLGHKTLAMTGRYVEKATDPLLAAADAVSGRVAAAMNSGREAEVVAFGKSPA